uniref:Uncharacterized protein n=1 Tax=Triticum urartu TaxID=4572 RepID=A0A8R7JZ25_TRIUA
MQTITLKNYIHLYQCHNQLASNNKISQMPTLCQNNHNII